MKKLLFLFSFLLFAVCSQAQFRLAVNGVPSWTNLGGGLYSATVTFHADLTGNSYAVAGIVDSMRFFTSRGQVFEIDSVWGKTFSQATLRVEYLEGVNSAPVGQGMVYETNGSVFVPDINFGSTGATAQLNQAVVTYNASKSATIIPDSSAFATTYRTDTLGQNLRDEIALKGDIDSLVLVQDSILVAYDASGSEIWRDTIAGMAASGADGNGIYSGDGTAPADVDVTVTDSINFDAGTLIIDGVNNRVGVGISSAVPAAQLSVRKDNIGVTQNNANGIVLANNQAATNGAQQMSPGLRFRGNGWKTGATAGSQTVDWLMDVLPVQGTAHPTGIWQLKSSINGGAYTNALQVLTNGNIFKFGSGVQINGDTRAITTQSISDLIISSGDGIVIGGANSTVTYGNKYSINTVNHFAPTSGTANYAFFLLTSTINQTGGANGITRGLYINPTLTSAADWRSIETSNTTGYSIYTASAPSYFGGNVSIGTASASRTLHVAGELRVTDLTTDMPTRMVGADADGDFGNVTTGTGLQFSNDTLNARGAYYKWVEVTSETYTITDEDLILVNCTSNNITLTLPTGASDGKQIIVKRIDTTVGRQVDWVGTLEGSVDPRGTLTTTTFPAYTIVKVDSVWIIVSEKRN